MSKLAASEAAGYAAERNPSSSASMKQKGDKFGSDKAFRRELAEALKPQIGYTGRIEARGLKPLPKGYRPTAHDIICGRGRGNYDCPGNLLFRQVVEEFVDQYETAASKSKKTIVLERIVAHVRTENKCRFIKKQEDTWFEVGDVFARQKAGHVIRECCTAQRLSCRDSSATRNKNLKAKDDCSESSVEHIASSQNHYFSHEAMATHVGARVRDGDFHLARSFADTCTGSALPYSADSGNPNLQGDGEEGNSKALSVWYRNIQEPEIRLLSTQSLLVHHSGGNEVHSEDREVIELDFPLVAAARSALPGPVLMEQEPIIQYSPTQTFASGGFSPSHHQHKQQQHSGMEPTAHTAFKESSCADLQQQWQQTHGPGLEEWFQMIHQNSTIVEKTHLQSQHTYNTRRTQHCNKHHQKCGSYTLDDNELSPSSLFESNAPPTLAEQQNNLNPMAARGVSLAFNFSWLPRACTQHGNGVSREKCAQPRNGCRTTLSDHTFRQNEFLASSSLQQSKTYFGLNYSMLSIIRDNVDYWDSFDAAIDEIFAYY